MKILYNFAHNRFLESQKLNTKTGYEIGGFDMIYQYGMNNIDKIYYNKNRHILDQPRGAGYWMWKFYFAKRLLEHDSIPEGSYIFYADSGSKFIGSIDSLIEVMDRDKISVMTFRQNHLSYIWTKRDAFVLTGCDEEIFTHTGARVGGWILLKKDDESRKFINQCYEYSQDYRIITDLPNQCGLPNYGGFIDHRHDESIISIVSKQFDYYPYRNPSQWGVMGDTYLTNNKYGDEGLKEMEERLGKISTWGNKYGCYYHGESLRQYPDITIDDRSTYPTILDLHKDPR